MSEGNGSQPEQPTPRHAERVPLGETPLIKSVPSIDTGELPQIDRRLTELPREELDLMRERLLAERVNPLYQGTALENLSDDIINNDVFLQFVVNDQKQMVDSQTTMYRRLNVSATHDQITQATLPEAIRHGLSDLDQNKHHIELAKKLFTDELTGLRNRAYYAGPLRDRVEAAIARGEEVAEVALDIDYFKSINDTYGHQVGDKALQDTGKLLESITPQFRKGSYTVVRLGGDEMRIVFIGPPQGRVIEGVRRIGDLSREHLRDFPIENRPEYTSFSMGVAFSNGRTDVNHHLLGLEADYAAYDSKGQEKDTFSVFNDRLETKVPKELVTSLDKAREEIRMNRSQA